MPRAKSAKALTAEMHRNEIRVTIDRLQRRIAEFDNHEGHPIERTLAQRSAYVIGALEEGLKWIRHNVDALDKLAK